MTRFCIAFFAAISSLLLSVPTASAAPSETLIEAWRTKAADLHQKLSSLRGNDIPDLIRLEITRFGRIAGQLANVETETGAMPEDLSCIFRGMEEEADTQLKAFDRASNPEKASVAKERLLLMFADAGVVGEAAYLALTSNDETEPRAHVEGVCNAAPVSKTAGF